MVGTTGLLPQLISCKRPEELASILEKHQVTAWVQLSEDGTVTIYNPAAEMGQGSMTSLPMIFAEEMDADWEKVEVIFSPQDPSIYGSDGWGPNRRIQLSAGSRVTKGYYTMLRKAGAQARQLLMENVARYWEVPKEELTTQSGKVYHNASGRSIGYGEIVDFLKIPEVLPAVEESQLKDPSQFRFIGKNQPRYDIPSKVDGSAQFAIDVRLPEMVYGVLERGKLHGAKPVLTNESEILNMPGIIKVVPFDYAIGVVAERLEQALEAKKKLSINWSESVASGYRSQDAYEKYGKKADEKTEGRVVVATGNFAKARQQAAKTYTVDFKNDYVYHAQMEPLNAVVQVSEDGQSAEVWVGSQQGFTPKMGVPGKLGIDPENIKINLMYLGGGFGRRSMTDFVEECAILAREMAPRPVKLIWTREDDLTYGAYRPLSLQRVLATTDKSGNLTGFSHLIVGDGDNLLASGIRNEFYSIPNQHAEIRIVSEGIRLKHWRAVGHGPNKYAVECTIDEIAHDQGVDPVDFRRKLMAASPRALATLDKAASMCNWGEPLPGDRARGVAFLERSGTLSTGICEISLDRTTGKIRVHHWWSANDAGVVIHPDNVKAQLEGGIIMGMSSVLKEQLTIKDGKVQQTNFDNYHLLRMEDVPESIETAIIDSNGHPQGVGESGTPLVAPAIANAFLALTGKRLRHLPFTPERVLRA
ncbi:MAG: molybdopterin-dependent oxidoreductase, partial [Eudoraea sp.]|nr:molybdopterin-dependent oxidoreductase [Eudoraea sp.]